MKKTIGIIACIGMAGCTTGYQAHTWTGGYKDQDLGNGRYQVEYLGNGTNTPEMVKAFWHQRAAELCPSTYMVVSIREGQDDIYTASYAGGIVIPISSSHPWVKGEIKCR